MDRKTLSALIAVIILVACMTMIMTANQQNTFNGRIALALKELAGTRYQWGGTTIRGVDCSGAVFWLWKQAGRPIPRMTSRKMHAIWGRDVPFARAKKYDLVFWTLTPNRPMGHVGIIDADGKHFWHASSREGFVRRKWNKYWRDRFVATGRIKI